MCLCIYYTDRNIYYNIASYVLEDDDVGNFCNLEYRYKKKEISIRILKTQQTIILSLNPIMESRMYKRRG